MQALKIKKISLTSIAALFDSYAHLVTYWKPEGPHEALLFEEACELHGILEDLYAKGKAHATLTLSSRQALAFTQLWAKGGHGTQLTQVVVDAIIAAIDQQRKSPTRLNLEIA